MIPERASSLAAKHLTEEELDDVLLGESTPEAELHLASCAQCSGALTSFREAMGAFNEASMAWSQAKANSMPIDLPRRRFAFSLGQVAAPAAMAFVAALAITIGLHRHAGVAVPSQVALSKPADDTAQNTEIASDNAMLAAIHSELYRPVPSPVEEYQPEAARTRRSNPGQARN